MGEAASHATFQVSGSTFRVSALEGSEAISTLFSYEIGCLSPLPLPRASDVIGAEGTLTLVDPEGRTRDIRGFVSEARGRAGDNMQGEIRFVLRPYVFDLTLGRASRTFQESTVAEILTTVLGPHAGSARLAFSGGTPIPYRVERGESDWAFIERTLAAAGLLYWFDHGQGSALVIADSLGAADALVGAPIPVLTESFVGSVTEGIVELGSGNEAGFSAHTVRSFRWDKPALDVSAKAGGGEYESYEHILEVKGLTEAGESRLKQSQGRADRQRITGVVRTVRLAPGVALSVDDHADTNARYVITSLQLGGELEGDGAHFVSFTSSFTAAHESAAPHPDAPPARLTQAGMSYGIVTASKGDEVFPDEAGQVRAQLHWDRGGAFNATSGVSVRVTQRLAPGSMMIPRTGWVLATLGQRGNADSPIALGRIFDGEHRPAYDLPANKTRVVYKTATTPGGGSFNEIHFEDRKGAEVQHIHASRDTEVLTRSIKSEIVHNDAEHLVDGQQILTHEDTMNSQVRLTQTTAVGRDEKVVVDRDLSKTASGNETITISGHRTIRGKSGHSTAVKHSSKLAVGAALIDISLGQIHREAKNALTLVGAAIVRIAGQSINRQVGPVWLETVGGVKYVKAGNSIAESATKNSTETIGGSVVLQAGTTLNEDSSESASWTVLGKFQGTAKEGLIEAHDLIEIRCGKSVLQIDPKGVTFSSTRIELAGDELELVTGTIEHN